MSAILGTNLESDLRSEIRILDSEVKNHLDTFRVVMLSICTNTIFPELLEIFGTEQVVKFMDIFGGMTIKIPDRSVIEKIVRYVDIWVVIHRSPNKIEAAELLAHKYEISREYVLDCYDTVAKIRKLYQLPG